MNKPKEIFVRNAFKGYKGRYLCIRVPGGVAVYDDVACHYTNNHSLTKNQIKWAMSRLADLK